MADIYTQINVESGTSKRLNTAGKYCDRDIVVTAIGEGGGDIPEYDGVYEVTPSVQTQTLQTMGKKMSKNITVNEIPYFVTENEAQGNTIYIGG